MKAAEDEQAAALADVFRGAAPANNEDVPMISMDPAEDQQAQVISRARDKSPVQPQSAPSSNVVDGPMQDIPDDRDLDAVLNDAEIRTLTPE